MVAELQLIPGLIVSERAAANVFVLLLKRFFQKWHLFQVKSAMSAAFQCCKEELKEVLLSLTSNTEHVKVSTTFPY